MSSVPKLDRFRRLRRLGAGSMGVVYEAVDTQRQVRVAMKTLLRADGESLLRFKREFRAFQDIQHPNLVNLYELVEEDGDWFFTMELVRGVDILTYVWGGDATTTFTRAPTLPADGPDDALSPMRTVDEDRLRDALGQLALGIAALHGADKIHRDIKPSNVMVTDEGRVVILDLGLVADQSLADASSGDHLVGTADYMAPEQALGRALPASDWYAMGSILYHAVTGQPPFDGSPLDVLMQKQDSEIKPPRHLVPDVPPDLDALCVDLLRQSPEQRPSARAILRRLGQDHGTRAGESSLLSPQQAFVGRDAELGQLEHAYTTAMTGSTVAVAVYGESGVGKTALVRELVNRVRAAGTPASPLVLQGRCYENESVRYNAFDGVIDALSSYLRRLPKERVYQLVPPEEAGLLVRTFPVLAQVEAIAGAPVWTGEQLDPDEQRSRMLAAVRNLFNRIATETPLLITIDDLQWANRDSLLLLQEITRPPDSPRMCLLITFRSPERHAPRPELELPCDLRFIRVAPLAEADAVELALSLLRLAGLPTEKAAAIAAEAEGHPMHIDALIRHSAHVDDSSSRPQLDQAIVARVATLPGEARRLLELICLAGAPIPREVIGRAAELDAGDLTRALAMLKLHNLARTSGDRRTDRVEPYHDRVRESIADALDDAARAAHHARFAVVLDAVRGDPEQLMRHQEAAGWRHRAADTALRAAARADEALAFDRAAELYQAALRLGDHDRDRERSIQLRLSEALANAGRGADAAASYLAAVDGADKATRLECYRRASEQWLMTGHLDRGLDTLRELLEQVGASYPATPRRALLSVVATRAWLRIRGLGWRTRDESELGREHLTRVDLFRSVGQGIGMVDNIRGAAFQARGLLMALRAGEPQRIGRALALESIFLASQGVRRLPRSRKLIAMVAELAAEDDYLKAWCVSAEGALRYFEGRFDEADSTLEHALELWSNHPAGNAWEKNNVSVFRMLALRFLGRANVIHRLAGEVTRYARRRGDRYLETTVRQLSTIAWLCQDKVHMARASLAAARWVPPEGRFHLQHWYRAEAESEIKLYEGRAGEAVEATRETFARLGESMLTRVETIRVMSRWLEGRMHLAAAVEDPAMIRTVESVVHSLRREKVRYARGFESVLRGGLAELRGDPAYAIASYRAARDCGMELIGAVARRRAAQLADDAAELAAAELELAELGVADASRIARVFAVPTD